MNHYVALAVQDGNASFLGGGRIRETTLNLFKRQYVFDISLGCGQNETFEDVVLGFGKH